MGPNENNEDGLIKDVGAMQINQIINSSVPTANIATPSASAALSHSSASASQPTRFASLLNFAMGNVVNYSSDPGKVFKITTTNSDGTYNIEDTDPASSTFHYNIDKNDLSLPTPPAASTQLPPPPPATPAKDYSKYNTMLKNRLPEGAVRQKMKSDGLSQADIDAFLSLNKSFFSP